MIRKKIIIVGSSSGIGREMAMIYARQDHSVAITGRRNELLEDLKNEYPRNIITGCFDVTEAGNQKQLASLIRQLNGLDLFIYNAGYGDPSRELDYNKEHRTTLTNVNGFVEMVCYVFNYFVQQGHGQIALTSSIAALRGNAWSPAYSASKAFMSNYAEGLAIKARKMKKDISVTDIRPGFIDTKMAKGNNRFWVASPRKAAVQIVKAIENKKRVAYITKRWWLIAQILKILPFSLYRRFV